MSTKAARSRPVAPAQTYLLHGLRVRSEVPLDEPPCADREFDVDVVWGERRSIPAALPHGRLVMRLELKNLSFSCSYFSGAYTLRFDDLCDVVVDRRGRSVSLHPGPELDPDFATVLLAGNVLAFILMIGRQCVLHASAVEMAGVTTAFVGHPGMGKSTLAALCCSKGARLVSDDLLRVEATDGRAWCFRGTAQIRLRDAAAELAGEFDPQSCGVTADGRVGIRAPLTQRSRLPLAALVAPRCSSDCKAPRLQRLAARDALIELLRYPRAIGWQDPDPLRWQFKTLAELAALIPVYIADLPPGPPFRFQAEALLARHPRRAGAGGPLGASADN